MFVPVIKYVAVCIRLEGALFSLMREPWFAGILCGGVPVFRLGKTCCAVALKRKQTGACTVHVLCFFEYQTSIRPRYDRDSSCNIIKGTLAGRTKR